MAKMKIETAKISELIKTLQGIKKESGDMPVYLSSDEKGIYRFHTIHNNQSFEVDSDLKYVIIYSWQNVDLE
jgi:hypothetical protein